MMQKLYLPVKPSDTVAQFLSNKSVWNYKVGECIEDGQRVYKDLRKLLLKEQRRQRSVSEKS
jgi:hypothetical protein